MDGHKKAYIGNKGQKKNEAGREDNFVKSIKAKSKNLPDGIYVRGSAQGYPILFTTDTGASKTIISKRIFDSMKTEDQPNLSGASRLIGACGTEIKEHGKGIFLLKVGPVLMEVEAIVADIDDDGLLGMDVLQNGAEGPAYILMSKGIMRIDKQDVPIIQVGLKTSVRRVAAADHVVIPGQCESVIDLHVERQDNDEFSSEAEYLVEPTKHFQNDYPLHMTTTVVDADPDGSCKVRIVNPFPTAVSIRQNDVIGQATLINKSCHSRRSVNYEHSSKEENESSIRRIAAEDEKTIPLHTSCASKSKEKVWDACGAIVPEHPRNMVMKSLMNLNPGQGEGRKSTIHTLETPFRDKANYADADGLKIYRGDYHPRWPMRARERLSRCQISGSQ